MDTLVFAFILVGLGPSVTPPTLAPPSVTPPIFAPPQRNSAYGSPSQHNSAHTCLPSQCVFHLLFQPLKGTCPIFHFPKAQISARLQIPRVTDNLRIFTGTCPSILVLTAIFFPLPVFDAAIVSLCLWDISAFYTCQFPFPTRFCPGSNKLSPHIAAVLICACPVLGTRGSLT